jgi:methionyl-tRNA synthetase
VQPIMPSSAERLWEQLGIPEPLPHQRVPTSVGWGGLKPGTATVKGGSLFPRVDID